MTVPVERITAATLALGDTAQEMSTAFDDIPETATIGDRQKVFIRLAHLLKPSALEFLDNTTELAQGMKLAYVGLMSRLDHIDATPAEDRATNFGEFLTQTINLAITTQEASKNYEGMEPTLLSMRSASRALRSPPWTTSSVESHSSEASQTAPQSGSAAQPRC